MVAAMKRDEDWWFVKNAPQQAAKSSWASYCFGWRSDERRMATTPHGATRKGVETMADVEEDGAAAGARILFLRVTLAGCDDSTQVDVMATPEQAWWPQGVAEAVGEARSYQCNPALYVEVLPIEVGA